MINATHPPISTEAPSYRKYVDVRDTTMAYIDAMLGFRLDRCCARPEQRRVASVTT
jgi:hypothetical protein